MDCLYSIVPLVFSNVYSSTRIRFWSMLEGAKGNNHPLWYVIFVVLLRWPCEDSHDSLTQKTIINLQMVHFSQSPYSSMFVCEYSSSITNHLNIVSFTLILHIIVCLWLAIGRWFSRGTPVSSAIKIERHNTALNTATLTFASCEFEEPRSWRGVLDTILCNKVCQWLPTGLWFLPRTPVSSTNKTDRRDIREILLKMV
jgi:hypothetical protein